MTPTAVEVVHRYKPGEDVPVKNQTKEKKLMAGRCIAFPKAKSAEGDYVGEYAAAAATRIFGVSDRETAEWEPKDVTQTPRSGDWTLRTNVTRAVGSIVRIYTEAEVKAGDEVQVGADGTVKKATEAKNAIGIATTTAKKEEYVEVILY